MLIENLKGWFLKSGSGLKVPSVILEAAPMNVEKLEDKASATEVVAEGYPP